MALDVSCPNSSGQPGSALVSVSFPYLPLLVRAESVEPRGTVDGAHAEKTSDYGTTHMLEHASPRQLSNVWGYHPNRPKGVLMMWRMRTIERDAAY